MGIEGPRGQHVGIGITDNVNALEEATYREFLRYYRDASQLSQTTGQPMRNLLVKHFARAESEGLDLDAEPLKIFRFVNPLFGEIVFYSDRNEATSPLLATDDSASLTPTEGRLLSTLMHQPERVFNRDVLFTAAVRDVEKDYSNERILLDQHISNLRHKLGDSQQPHRLVYTIRDKGLSLTPNGSMKRVLIETYLSSGTKN